MAPTLSTCMPTTSRLIIPSNNNGILIAYYYDVVPLCRRRQLEKAVQKKAIRKGNI